jgi:hypothetical protein
MRTLLSALRAQTLETVLRAAVLTAGATAAVIAWRLAYGAPLLWRLVTALSVAALTAHLARRWFDSLLSPQLPPGYDDPAVYAVELLLIAYAPAGLEQQAAAHAHRGPEWLLSPAGIAALQRAVADDPRAALPEYVRHSLRAAATTVSK